jgi:hypothetical protein
MQMPSSLPRSYKSSPVILLIPRLKAGAGFNCLFRGEQGSKEKGVVQRKAVGLRIPVVDGRMQVVSQDRNRPVERDGDMEWNTR